MANIKTENLVTLDATLVQNQRVIIMPDKTTYIPIGVGSKNVPGGGGTDVSDTTATNHDVLSGKYFYTAAGVKMEGAIINVSAQPNPTVTINATSGLVTASYTALAGFTEDNTQHSETLQISSSNVPNLLASNIKKDVTLLGVTGTYEGGGGSAVSDVYKVSTYSSTQDTTRLVVTAKNTVWIGADGTWAMVQTNTGATGTARIFQAYNSTETLAWNSTNSRWETSGFASTSTYLTEFYITDIDNSSDVYAVSGEMAGQQCGYCQYNSADSDSTGTYTLQNSATGRGRQYKHGDWYVYCWMFDSETSEPRLCTDSDTSGTWVINQGLQSYPQDMQGSQTGESPVNSSWDAPEYSMGGPLGYASAFGGTTTLKGKKATAYSGGTWTFSATEETLTNATANTPVVGNGYVVVSNAIVSATIGSV